MQAAEFKSLISALVLPPAGPLLLAMVGLLLVKRWRRLGLFTVGTALLAGGLLCTNGVGLLLFDALLERPVAVQPATLQARQVQAIVVLGGGVIPEAPEYGVPQPGGHTLGRLRYGAWLARHTGLPLGFAGGLGWSVTGTSSASEGSVAARVLQEDFRTPLRWNDDRSRDTQENAENMARLLRRDGIRRIALVTDAWHMQRSVGHFRAQGLEVVPAPMGFPGWRERALLEWLPSVHGLELSRMVIREWLGQRVVPPRPPPVTPAS